MIKKILLAVAVAFPMLAMAQSPKFGTINTQVVIEAMPEFKTAQEQLSASSKKYEEEFQKLQDELQKLYADFQALPADTPESIKERRIQDIQERDQKMQQFHATATQDIQRQQQTLMIPIQEKVRNAIAAVGKEESLTFVFEVEMPLYQGADVVDITPAVRTKLGIK